MAFQTKKSVMAIVEETTEGTPVSPSAATDFIAIQDGFSLEAAFDTLENAELTGSIGKAKPIQGFEAPTASLDHYVRHSGVEGQEPGYGLLLEAAFGGKTVQATERDVVSATAGTASVAATITVDTGEGVEFERGGAVLIKDGTNGYAIRNVKSVSGDILTLAQNLSNAPAAAVNLGKRVQYKGGEAHPTLSLWDYRANEAALQVSAGNRVTEFSMEASAGELVNGSYSLEGILYHYNPIEITATNKFVDFDVTGPVTAAASVTEKLYKDPYELASALETAMNAAQAVDTITVSYSDSNGKFTIASDGTLLSLDWNSGTNAANTMAAAIGFDNAADDTGATSYESDNAQDLSASFTPSFDSAEPLVAKDNHVMLGDFDDISCFSTQSVSFTLSDTKADELDVCSASGKSGSIITEREVTVELVANLPQYDADKFKRFRTNQEVQFTYNFGEKSGGNWVAGKCANLFLPTAVISEFSLDDADGLVTLNMTLTAYVDSGLGEVYLNFL